MAEIEPRAHRASLANSLAFFEQSIDHARASAERPVPSCPGWTVADLYGHLGSVHRWILPALAAAGSAQKIAPRQEWAQQGDAFEFFTTSARALLTALDATDPQAEVWTFGPPPRIASFWFRRQNHKHLIHAEDLARALASVAPPVSADLALDGVDEVLSIIIPQRVRAGLADYPAQRMTFSAGEMSWTLGDGPAEVVLRTDPLSLYFGLWRRASLTQSTVVTGDPLAVRQFLEGPTVP